jgi:hypothetical protein
VTAAVVNGLTAVGVAGDWLDSRQTVAGWCLSPLQTGDMAATDRTSCRVALVGGLHHCNRGCCDDCLHELLVAHIVAGTKTIGCW